MTVARPFNTYGPRQSARAVIPTIIAQALERDEIRLGSLTPVRDLTFVDDTVAGFLAVAGSNECTGQVVNLGSGNGISIGDLAGMVLECVGKTHLAVVSEDDRKRPETSEVYELVSDNRKAGQVCGWTPKVGLREGLERTIAWVETHIHWMKTGLYNT